MNDTATLSRLFSGIQQDLDVVEQTFQERASSGLDLLNLASAHALSSPGKRLRTALTLLSGKLGDYLFEKLLLVSVAFEMVHLATLIHDDIIDHADTRRGIPTVNARWGEGVAILLGDYLFARTAGTIADLNDTRVIRLFSDTVATVCEGTILETLAAGQLDLSVDAYLERISRKTACLMAACCKGGAIVSNASEEQAEALYRFGIHLGTAFQIVDDVLDYTGSEESVGKPTGNDLRQGLITLPLIYALQAQNNGHSEAVQQYMLDKRSGEDNLNAIVHWVAQGPGIEAALEDAERFGQRARDELSIFPPSHDREVLEELTDFVLERQR
ncbi:MAG TPA: polyprenyl synthetase family protein [Ktedonobacterales bacterium]|nr:polyprenyl synthetase family protein [Ktedonobacterales bacterium]